MRRLGNIFERVIDRENLALAFCKVCKGKRFRKDIKSFSSSLEENLNLLHSELENGCFRFGEYNLFKIYDPKERVIAAAPVRDRIVHHALIQIIGEKIEKSLVDKSYACRKGKGQWVAVNEAKRLAEKFKWCLKLDIKSFFDEINHEILYRTLSRKIKDKKVLLLIKQLIDGYNTEEGKGLPIGNLTSQYFANLYLDKFDRWFSQIEYEGKYFSLPIVRYMDDILVFGDHDILKKVYREVPVFLDRELKLSINNKGGLHRTKRGVDFLGTRVFPNRIMLAKRSKKRFAKKVKLLDELFELNEISERRYQTQMTQLFAFVKKCNSFDFRKKIILDEEARELSPRARRLLERQQQRGLCSSLPQWISKQQLQQQHEPEQQLQLLGLPCLLSTCSSTKKIEFRLNSSLSSTILMDSQTQKKLSGVGRLIAEDNRENLRFLEHMIDLQGR